MCFYTCGNDSVSWQSPFMPRMSLLFRAVCEFFSVLPSTWAADLNNLRHGFNARSDSVQFPLKPSKKRPLTNKETGLTLLSVLSWSQQRQHCKSVILISVKSIDGSWECRCKIVAFLFTWEIKHAIGNKGIPKQHICGFFSPGIFWCCSHVKKQIILPRSPYDLYGISSRISCLVQCSISAQPYVQIMTDPFIKRSSKIYRIIKPSKKIV